MNLNTNHNTGLLGVVQVTFQLHFLCIVVKGQYSGLLAALNGLNHDVKLWLHLAYTSNLHEISNILVIHNLFSPDNYNMTV